MYISGTTSHIVGNSDCMRLIANSHIFISNQVSRYFMRPNRQSKQNHLVFYALQKIMILWRGKIVFTKQHHHFFPNSKGFIFGTEHR